MSRLGKLPIELKEGTQAKIENNFIIIKGPKGELRQELHKLVQVEVDGNKVTVNVKDKENKKEKSLWGMYFSLIRNMAVGVNEGFEKKLEINGVGYRVAASGNKLNLSLGFSHPVVFDLPEGVSAQAEGNIITLKGANKQLVGETAARIRKIRKPEPYKGKGIKYIDEVIIKKEGKTAAKGDK